MCRSSRLTVFIVGLALLPSAAFAQFYGFPSEVGVIDDGYGVLPPQPRLFDPGPFGAPPPPPFPPIPAAAERVPCPLIIEIGRGVKRAARTRVTYGRPSCG